MHAGFGLFLFVICILLPIQTNQGFLYHHSEILQKYHDIPPYDDNLFESSTVTESNLFFQNEPVPLASSVVDDLTTLASTVYIISLIIIILVVLAWITHYNAPCSSIITSILSALTGLPEPIIQSVALCGSCCIWCEKTWLFRRIHQFNIWISRKIKQFVSGTCKILYDTICPCCRPPDTPSNRSIIGSLPAGIIAMIDIPDAPPNLSPSKPIVTILEPISISSKPLIENQDYSASNVIPVGTKLNSHQIDENKPTRIKRRKRPRKRAQLKQGSAIDELAHTDEQIDDFNEDEEDDDNDEENI